MGGVRYNVDGAKLQNVIWITKPYLSNKICPTNGMLGAVLDLRIEAISEGAYCV